MICRLVHGNGIPMGITWETSHGMGWDRHKLLWDGSGTDKYVLWTTLMICVKVFRSTFKAMSFQGLHWLQTLGSCKASFGAKVV